MFMKGVYLDPKPIPNLNGNHLSACLGTPIAITHAKAEPLRYPALRSRSGMHTSRNVMVLIVVLYSCDIVNV